MLKRPLRFSVAPILALAALCASANPLHAQLPQTRISGSVSSETGEKIVGAQVKVIGSNSSPSLTSEDGTFDLFVLNDMTPRLVVRRIGFKPESLVVMMPIQQALNIRLTRVVQMVRPVLVNAANAEINTTLAMVKERERTS